jgi:hypothetical protein
MTMALPAKIASSAPITRRIERQEKLAGNS